MLTYPLVGNYGVPPSFESQGSRPALSCRSLRLTTATRARKEAWRIGCAAKRFLPGGHRYSCAHQAAARQGRCSARCSTERTCPSTIRTVATRGRSRQRAHRSIPAASAPLCWSTAEQGEHHRLRARGLTIIRVPSDYDFLGEDFDGVLSNGPGDPRSCGETIRHLARAARQASHHGHLPGHQLALAGRREHLQAGSGTAATTSPASRKGPGSLLHHLAEPRLRGGSGDASRRLGSLVHQRQRRLERGDATAWSRSSACSSTRRRRPARSIASRCSMSS